MTVSRVLFTKLIVTDMAAMIAFYERAFGFVVSNRLEFPGLEEVLLSVPDDRFSLVLYRHTDGREVSVGTAHGPLGLATRDLDATWEAALAAGATAVQPPRDLPGMRIAFVDDPEGHPLEFIQYQRATPREGATA